MDGRSLVEPGGPGYRVRMSRRWLPLLLLSAAAASCAVPSKVDVVQTPFTPTTRTFHSHGISFQYPGNWVAFDAQTPDPQQAPTQKSQDIVGLDDLNIVSITAQLAPQSDHGFSVWDKRIVSQFSDAFLQNGIEVRSGPEKILVGGEKSLRWKIRQPSGIGYVLDTTLVVMFRGDTEYYVRCQHTAARGPEIDHGCDQVLTSFKLGKAQA
jgi:hypothetical protein